MRKIYLSLFAKSVLRKGVFILPLTLLHLCSIAQPSLVITEIMANPAAVTDTDGEWFEIYNKSTMAVILNKLIVSSGTSRDTLLSTSSIVLPAGAYFVLGNNIDAATNGNIKIDYAYDRIGLANTEDDVTLYDSNGVQIDQVAYLTSKSGASYSLSHEHLDVAENDLPSNWCFAVLPYNNTDKGTPGNMNDCTNMTTDIANTDLNNLSVILKDRKLQFRDGNQIQSVLFDSQGKMRGTFSTTSNEEVDLSNYANGLYIVKITDNGKEKTFKIVLY